MKLENLTLVVCPKKWENVEGSTDIRWVVLLSDTLLVRPLAIQVTVLPIACLALESSLRLHFGAIIADVLALGVLVNMLNSLTRLVI